MGFLDNVQNSLNRGVAATSRAGNTMKLKAQINEVMKRRQGLAAQLGANLYEATKDDPAFRAGREELYDGMAACDAEREACQAEIDRLEAESAAATAASQVYECPFCYAQVAATAMFCSGCGRPVAEIRAAYDAAPAQPAEAAAAAPFGTCPACGAPIRAAGDAFCMSCGNPLGAAPNPPPTPADFRRGGHRPPATDDLQVPRAKGRPEPAPTN